MKVYFFQIPVKILNHFWVGEILGDLWFAYLNCKGSSPKGDLHKFSTLQGNQVTEPNTLTKIENTHLYHWQHPFIIVQVGLYLKVLVGISIYYGVNGSPGSGGWVISVVHRQVHYHPGWSLIHRCLELQHRLLDLSNVSNQETVLNQHFNICYHMYIDTLFEFADCNHSSVN